MWLVTVEVRLEVKQVSCMLTQHVLVLVCCGLSLAIRRAVESPKVDMHNMMEYTMSCYGLLGLPLYQGRGCLVVVLISMRNCNRIRSH